LIDKYPPMVAKLALAPGTKEPRYGQLLGGEEALAREETAAGLGRLGQLRLVRAAASRSWSRRSQQLAARSRRPQRPSLPSSSKQFE
jgi:uncharacterized protein YceH (UPF0502 family)